MLLTRVKLSFISKIVFKKALESTSKFCMRGGYRAISKNRNYFELAKLTICKTQLLNTQNASDSEQILDAKEKSEFSILTFAWESLLISIRVIVITTVASGLLTFYFITQLFGLKSYPKVYLKALEFLGPTFVKLGQWMSTRRDLYPAELCDCLSRLQRDTSAHSWHYTRHLLAATYGPAWRQLFPLFDKTPVGSGCCAQVHRALLNSSFFSGRPIPEPSVPLFVEVAEFFCLGHLIDLLGTRSERKPVELPDKVRLVAVKVLHPRVGEQLRRDLTILRFVSKCATTLVPSLKWLSITDTVDDFSQIMEKQVDLEYEANNLVRFANNFSATPEVQFPQPYVMLSNKRILVETYQEGRPIADYLQDENQARRRKLAETGLRSVFKMIFEDNFVHCDLHPGNMLVEEKENEERPRLVILDCGLATELTEDYRRNLRDVFQAVATGDGRRAANLMLKHSPYECADPDGFLASVDRIITSHLHYGAKLDNINVGHVMSELFAALVRHRVKQDASFSSVILSIAVIEGLGRSLDPSIDIIRELGPFVASDKLGRF